MRHIFFSFILLFFIQFAQADSQSLRIGFILPLSGDLAFLGSGIRNGALLARDDLAKQGRQLDLVFEDNRGELAATSRLASKLINTDKVNAIVSIISGVGSILSPIVSQSKILHVGICSDPSVADGRFSFVNYLTAEQGVATYLKQFRASVGSDKSLAIIQANESGFERISWELNRKSKNNPRVVEIQTFNKGSTDFRSILLRVVKAKPDAILMLGLSPEIELLARQARSLRISIPFTSIEGFGLARDKTPLEGAWFIDAASPNSSFRHQYVGRFGIEVTPGVGHSYDTVQMISSAFRSADSSSILLNNFRAIADFPGVIGPLSVQADGIVWSDASVKRIVAGEVQEFEQG